MPEPLPEPKPKSPLPTFSPPLPRPINCCPLRVSETVTSPTEVGELAEATHCTAEVETKEAATRKLELKAHL